MRMELGRPVQISNLVGEVGPPEGTHGSHSATRRRKHIGA